MKLNCVHGQLTDLSDSTLVIFTPEIENLKSADLRAVDQASGGAIASAIESGEFTGKSGENLVLATLNDLEFDRAIVAGLGEKKQVDHDSYRKAAGIVSRMKALKSYPGATFFFSETDQAEDFQATVEGYILGSHKLLEFKSGDAAISNQALQSLTFAIPNRRLLPRLEKAVARGEIIGSGQAQVRILSDTPANFLNPRTFAERAQKLAREIKGLKCRVMDQKSIEREKMGALLSVSRGSDEPPRFVVLEYKGGKDTQKPIVIVGKGVTFDSGGLSLKAAAMMPEMKGDMTGAGVTLMTVATLARLEVKHNIIGLIPLVENMPSAHATRPSDIVTSRKGLTVEVINTEAEGRMILADALDYANRYEPQAVIDICTLTGAALYVLGYSGAPIMGNNPKLMDRLRDSADATAERVWELPLWDDFHDRMKSPIADLRNSGGKAAGTACAGAFLENFVGDWPWAHVDIAYVDVEPVGRPYQPKGVTGVGMRLLVDLVSNWKKL